MRLPKIVLAVAMVCLMVTGLAMAAVPNLENDLRTQLNKYLEDPDPSKPDLDTFLLTLIQKIRKKGSEDPNLTPEILDDMIKTAIVETFGDFLANNDNVDADEFIQAVNNALETAGVEAFEEAEEELLALLVVADDPVVDNQGASQ